MTQQQPTYTTSKGITWTMNCILFGARIVTLVQEGKDAQTLDEILNLTSDFDSLTANYLLMRLTELKGVNKD